MKRLLFVASAALAIAASSSASAGGWKSRWFIGLWEGVDPVDGSAVVYSISDNDRDGDLEIVARETFFFACNGDGIQIGHGTVSRRGVLEARQTLKCRPGPLQFTDTRATLEPVEEDDILVVKVPADDPATVPITLHRVSR